MVWPSRLPEMNAINHLWDIIERIRNMSLSRLGSSMYKSYQNLLRRYPVGVQAVQTSVFTGVGDVIAQLFVEKKEMKDFDVMRLLRFGAIGGIYIGPVLRTWFGFLDSRFKGRSAIIVVKKVALDQLCFVPLFLGVLVSIIGFGNGKSVDQVKEKLEADYPDIMMTNYKIWPLVQTLNFSVVPVHYQVPLVQVVAVGWNTYMSWKAHQPVQKKQELAHVE
ncbi:protein Mpv17-like isoform X2 [Schistocerca serialis cubense]|uniref:protein Mpv17-like isoform X2 n=1 Tax=Schistocerca serialis cubense TaxID=2023355 RepID=UPI00214E9C16|nr:protein Mpv17-like isoform X2 [Schistocerca serialis cubense]